MKRFSIPGLISLAIFAAFGAYTIASTLVGDLGKDATWIDLGGLFVLGLIAGLALGFAGTVLKSGDQDMSGRRVLFTLLIIVGALMSAFIIILVSGDVDFQTKLWEEAAKTILELALIGILGAYAAFLFNQYAADRQKQVEKRERDTALRAAGHKSRVEALNSLTTSYWQVKKALHIIYAHRSAKSYGEQMRLIIDYRLELQRLNNEIRAGTYQLSDNEAVSKILTEMDTRLEELLEEWKSVYLDLSRLQKEDETTDDLQKKQVPTRIDALPVLNQIKQDHYEALHGPFEYAAGLIRKQIRADWEKEKKSDQIPEKPAK